MKQRGTFSIQRLALIGMMAAMVFALTYVGIDIPTGLGKTKIHFGNIMCLLSAFLLGPVGGGLAAGVGSALFDLMDPMWAPECWITFLNKFVMAFVAGGVMRKASFLAPRVRVWTAALCGSLSYSILYLGKNVLESLYVKGFTWQVTQVEVLATKQEAMGESLERLNEKMDSLERRPGQRWESLVDKVLLVLAWAFVSFLLAGGTVG